MRSLGGRGPRSFMRSVGLAFALFNAASGSALLLLQFEFERLISSWTGPVLIACGLVLGGVALTHGSPSQEKADPSAPDCDDKN